MGNVGQWNELANQHHNSRILRGQFPHYAALKGEFRFQYKLGSNERVWKLQKNEPLLTFMYQLVLEISEFEIIFPPHKDTTILLTSNLIPIKKKLSMMS